MFIFRLRNTSFLINIPSLNFQPPSWLSNAWSLRSNRSKISRPKVKFSMEPSTPDRRWHSSAIVGYRLTRRCGDTWRTGRVISVFLWFSIIFLISFRPILKSSHFSDLFVTSYEEGKSRVLEGNCKFNFFIWNESFHCSVRSKRIGKINFLLFLSSNSCLPYGVHYVGLHGTTRLQSYANWRSTR